MVRHSDKFEQNAADPSDSADSSDSVIRQQQPIVPTTPPQEETAFRDPSSSNLANYFTDRSHPLSNKRVSLGRIVACRNMYRWDQVHHITSALFVTFFYVYFLATGRDISLHRYFTILSLFITFITRIYALVHFLLDLPDQSISARVSQYLQSWCVSMEATVFIFYWAVLAESDLSLPRSDLYLAGNFFYHLGAFLVAAFPFFITRSYLRKLHLFALILPMCLVYLLFMFIWTVPAGQEPIYKVIDFKSGMTAVYLLCSLAPSAFSYFTV